MQRAHEALDAARSLVNQHFHGVDTFDALCQVFGSLLVIYTVWHLITDFHELRKRALATVFAGIKKIPAVRRHIQKEKDGAIAMIRSGMKTSSEGAKYLEIPEDALSRDQALDVMRSYKKRDDPNWADGKLSGCIFVGDDEHTEFTNSAYALFASSNPLFPEVFPAVRKFEAEVIKMTATMLHGGSSVCGVMTGGGTESILMAVKAYKEFAKSRTSKPEIVVPVSAHAAFDKACDYFGVKLVHVPLDANFKVDLKKVERSINRNTIAIVGSAPGFPHGIIDDIEGLAKIALKRGVGLHVDCCMGGFVLPFAKAAGFSIPNFDFSVSGVTSISSDTHKFGYAPKGTSVLVFANPELRAGMFFVASDWQGGVYASPSIAGSRSGGLIAAAWASLITIGQSGYREKVTGIMRAAQDIKAGIKTLSDDLFLIGDPNAMIIAFSSKTLDIFKVNDAMAKRKWHLSALQKPVGLHICVTARQINMAATFLEDLKSSIDEVKNHPENFKTGKAAIYGMAASVPDRAIVKDLAKIVLDVMLES